MEWQCPGFFFSGVHLALDVEKRGRFFKTQQALFCLWTERYRGGALVCGHLAVQNNTTLSKAKLAIYIYVGSESVLCLRGACAGVRRETRNLDMPP